MSRRTTKLSNLSEKDFHMLSNTVVYDKDGKKIGEIDSGSYVYVKIDKISKYVQQGYMSSEDKKFMEHGGVNLPVYNPWQLCLFGLMMARSLREEVLLHSR